jgi:hypothetical protein
MQCNSKGFYDTSEAAARKHDEFATSLGRSGSSQLNFPLGVEEDPLLAVDSTAGAAGAGGAAAAGAGAAFAHTVSASATAVAKRWAWRCDMVVNATLLADAITKVLTSQAAACPDLWPRA